MDFLEHVEDPGRVVGEIGGSHVLRLFLKPAEVAAMCAAHGMETMPVHGSRPVIGTALARMLVTRSVPSHFRFTFTRSTLIAFTGFARKKGAAKPR
ncbi:hypothetical protein BH11MYX4_BH11MYX4_61400 [soil metagenome]